MQDNLSHEQQQALALARARRRRAEAEGAQPAEDTKLFSRDQAAVLGYGHGGTFGALDEIGGAAMNLHTRISNAVTGDDRDPNTMGRLGTQVARMFIDRAREDHPVTTAAAEMGGGIAATAAGGLGLASAAPRAAAGAHGFARAHPVVAASSVGAAEGGLYGFNADQGSAAERLDGAAGGAAFGAATGTGGVMLARGTRSLAREGRRGANEIIDAVRARGIEVPELDDLAAATRQAYQAVQDSGAVYSRPTIRRLANDIQARAGEMNLSAARHPHATSMISDIVENADNEMTLVELDQLRQVVRRDLFKGSDQAERAFGQMIVEQIDDAIARARPRGAVGQEANQLIRTARAASRRQRASEALEDAIEAANDRAASTGSGGNVQNALRQNLRRLITNERTRRLYTQEQREMIRDAIRGDDLQNMLRLVGKLSPDSGAIQALTGAGLTGATLTGGLGPGAMAVPLAGYLARRAAEARQGATIDRIVRTVRTGGN